MKNFATFASDAGQIMGIVGDYTIIQVKELA